MKTSLTALLLSFLMLASCIKEPVKQEPVPATPTIHGLWVGTYTADGYASQGSLFASWIIYPDGKMFTRGMGGDGKEHFSSGTWSLSADTLFTGNITTLHPDLTSPISQRVTATLTKDGTLINGTWTDTVNPYGIQKGKYSTLQKIK